MADLGVVAVVETTPATVLADVEQLAELAGMAEHLPQGPEVILKDNLSWHLPFLSANTTPWQLEGTIQALARRDLGPLTAVHNDTVVTDPFRGGRLNRLTPVYAKYGVAERFNFRPTDMRWVSYEPRSPLLALDSYFPEGLKLPDFFLGKNVVHLPTVKCHIYTTTTGAMKNAFGGLVGTRRHYTHSRIHEVLVDLLSLQREIHPGIFTVMDGTLAGDGPGPRTMRPVAKNLLLASGDPVAIDALAAKMMGFDPLSIPYIRLAHEAGLGVGDPARIEVRGRDVAGESWGFQVGRNLAGKVGGALWFSPLSRLQHVFFRTPLVHLFIWASYVFHDWLWWPTVGRSRMRRVARGPWGRLFASYPQE
ncbi:MAG: DUF362 domain-containing protein [Deltaproteobacteria bacterium]|nr:DUF362 domain-containing protein [Deltaproteobacteria bacterium]